MTKKKYYAVKKGKTPGIYFSWEDCKNQVYGFAGAIYKSFKTISEAEAFITECKDAVEEDITGKTEEPHFLEEGQAVAYVDGSYDVQSREYSCGIVFFFDGGEEHISEKGCDLKMVEMRNVAGEIWGAQRAMEKAVQVNAKSLTIFHDYQGISSWCLGEWKTNKEGTKAYKAFFDSLQGKLKVQFIKVKGHSGDKYNDLADELAKKALQM